MLYPIRYWIIHKKEAFLVSLYKIPCFSFLGISGGRSIKDFKLVITCDEKQDPER